MQTFAETYVHFDAAHLSINLVSEIAVATHVCYLNTEALMHITCRRQQSSVQLSSIKTWVYSGPLDMVLHGPHIHPYSNSSDLW